MLSQRTPHTEANILPIITSFSDIGKSFIATIHKNWHAIADDAALSAIRSSKHLSAFKSKSSSIHNYLVHSTQTYGLSQYNTKPTVATLYFSLPPNNFNQLIVVMLTTSWNPATCYKNQHILQ